jgi:hypothetical protein
MNPKQPKRLRPLKRPEKAIRTERLPEFVLRPLAAKFALTTTRTLRRAELKGERELIRRNSRVCGYRKANFLAFLGLA